MTSGLVVPVFVRYTSIIGRNAPTIRVDGVSYGCCQEVRERHSSGGHWASCFVPSAVGQSSTWGEGDNSCGGTQQWTFFLGLALTVLGGLSDERRNHHVVTAQSTTKSLMVLHGYWRTLYGFLELMTSPTGAPNRMGEIFLNDIVPTELVTLGRTWWGLRNLSLSSTYIDGSMVLFVNGTCLHHKADYDANKRRRLRRPASHNRSSA